MMYEPQKLRNVELCKRMIAVGGSKVGGSGRDLFQCATPEFVQKRGTS